MKTLVIFIALFMFEYIGLEKVKPDFEEKIDQILKDYYEAGKFNGNILIAINGEKVYNKALGYADLKNKTSLKRNSVYCLASISKIFTSAAILSLEKLGKLSIEDGVRTYLPELPEIYNAVRIKHLLSHTSGIPEDWSDWRTKINKDNSYVFQYLKTEKELEFEPGTRYAYSNNGFVLLALVVEKVSGETFQEYLEQNIFRKTGMTNSFVRTRNGGKINADITKSYVKGEQADWPLFTYGAGGIYSTADDLYKWDQAFFSYEVFDKPTVTKVLTQVEVEYKLQNYGLGWGVLNIGTQTIAGHTGGMFGFRTLYEHQLKNNVAIILLSNIGETPTMEIRTRIDQLIKENYPDY